MKLPQVMGLVFCRRFAVNTTTHEASLEGLFQAIEFKSFPTQPQRFDVYAALYSGRAEGAVELVGRRLETEKDVYRYRRWFSFTGGYVIQLQIPVRKMVFAAPGRYQFALMFEGAELTKRFLEISQED